MEEFNAFRAKMREHVAQMVVAIGQPDEIVPAESIQVTIRIEVGKGRQAGIACAHPV